MQGKTTIKSGVANKIEAAIISQGDTIIEDSGNNATLNINGIAGSLGGGIVVQREKNNNQDPAVVFNYDSQYLVSFTDKLVRPRISWQEIAP